MNIGNHTLCVEDDMVHLVTVGGISLAEITTIHAEIKCVLTQLGRAYILSDNSRAGTLTPEVRRFIAEWNRVHKVSAVAVINGGGLASRTMATLLLRALSLVRANSLPIRFLNTKEEARLWFAELRKKSPTHSVPDSARPPLP